MSTAVKNFEYGSTAYYDALRELGDMLKNGMENASNFFKTKVAPAASEFAKDSLEFMGKVGRGIASGLQSAGSFIADKASDARDFIREKAPEVRDFIKDKASDARDFIKDRASAIGGKVKEVATNAWENVKEQAPVVINKARNKVQQWINETPEKLKALQVSLEEKRKVFMDKAKANAQKLSEWYKKARENLPQINLRPGRENSPQGNALATATENATNIDNSLDNGRRPLLPIVREKIQAIKETLSAAASTLKDRLSEMKENFQENHPNFRIDLAAAAAGVAGVATQIGNSISKKAKDVKKALENTANKIKLAAEQIQEDAMNKIDQIKKSLKNVPEAISALAGQFKDFVKETIQNIREQMEESAELAEQETPEYNDVENEAPENDTPADNRKPRLSLIARTTNFYNIAWEPIIQNNLVVSAQPKNPIMKKAYAEYETYLQYQNAIGEPTPKTTPRIVKTMEFKSREAEIINQNNPQNQENQQEAESAGGHNKLPSFKDFMNMEWVPIVNNSGKVFGAHLKDLAMRPIYVNFEKSFAGNITPRQTKFEEFKAKEEEMFFNKSLPKDSINLDKEEFEMEPIPVTPEQAAQGLAIRGVRVKDPIIREALEKQAELEEIARELPHIRIPGAKNMPHISDITKDEPVRTGLDDTSMLGAEPVTKNPVLKEPLLPQDLVIRITIDPELKKELTEAIRTLNGEGRLNPNANQRAIDIINQIKDQFDKINITNLPAKGNEKHGMTNYSAGKETNNPTLGD